MVPPHGVDTLGGGGIPPHPPHPPNGGTCDLLLNSRTPQRDRMHGMQAHGHAVHDCDIGFARTRSLGWLCKMA